MGKASSTNRSSEYNGEHHYQEMGFFGPVEAYQIRDREKLELCKRQGITMVVVPYWWDQQAASLAATLHKAAPGLPIAEELLCGVRSGQHSPIPTQDPEQRQRKTGRPGVWDGRTDPTGLWQCPRLEGIAVRLDPVARTVHTRASRRTLPLPSSWLAALPSSNALGTAEVEGDLCAPGLTVGQLSGLLFRLSSSSSSSKRESESEGVSGDRRREERSERDTEGEIETDGERDMWRSLRFMAADVADLSLPFSERARALAAMPTTKTFSAVPYTLCEGSEALAAALESDHAAGGAGFLLRDGAAPYRLGVRSQAVLKATHVSKTEAVVVERCKDVRGLVVQLPSNGRLQVARCSAVDHLRPPPRGTAVLLGHMGVWPSTGRLKHPFLLRTNV